MLPAAVRAPAFGLLIAIVAACGWRGASAQDAARPVRLALVIGEAAYPQARLTTANADAGLMATAFAQAGFDVTALADADVATLRRTIAAFAAKARAAGPTAALALYVSGYGLQYAGENWLVPAGARIDRGAEVRDAAMRLSDFAVPLENVPAATRLFLFDLARETPFARKGMPLAGGLALAEAPVGSIYAYNTAPGAVAPPDVPPYGAYARALAETMQEPGLGVGEMLRRVRLRVGERTDGAAVPFDDGSADPGFTFLPGSSVAPAPLPAVVGLAAPLAYSTTIARDTLPGYVDFVAAFPNDPLVGRVRAMEAARREALIWSEARRADTPRAYWTYMRRYPRGPHFADVRQLLFELKVSLEPPPRFEIVPFEGLPPPSPVEIAALDHPSIDFADPNGTSIPPPPVNQLPPPRAAFFDTLPPPPLAPVGALPLPLPVAMPDGQSYLPGRIDEPAVPGGALTATLDANPTKPTITTAKADGTIVSRLTTSLSRNVRTIEQRSATGAMIFKATVAGSPVTMTEFGPADRLLGRSVGRDLAVGSRAVTMFDADGVAFADTIVSAEGIVTASAMVPGRPRPPHLVIAAMPNAKGEPVIVPEIDVLLRESLPPAVTPETERSKEAGKAAAGAVEDPVKAPALPSAAGLTGQAPHLDLPPPPPAPAFDAAAAPVASAATEAVPKSPPPAAAPPPPLPPTATPAPRPPEVQQPSATPTISRQAEAATSNLPSEPPLPPPRTRSVERKGRPRDKR